MPMRPGLAARFGKVVPQAQIRAAVVGALVDEGDTVGAGDPVATIEAMKMEASINAPVAGVVKRVVLPATTQLDGGDLVVVIEPA